MKFLRSLLFDFFIAFSLVLLINIIFIEEFVVRGNSMVPSVFPREKILVLKFPLKKLSRCDVVVFRYPNDPRKIFIKRIAGLPGEEIKIRDGRFYLNGKEENFSCLKIPRDVNIKRRIPEGFYFVLGDNPDVSNDSRYGWLVPKGFLRGRVIAVYWPLFDMRVIR